jgi:hypothetical protein
MHTTWIQQPGAPAAIAKQHQLLAQNLDLQWQIAHLLRCSNRLPVAAHELTTGRARTHFDQGLVEVLSRPGVSTAVA